MSTKNNESNNDSDDLENELRNVSFDNPELSDQAFHLFRLLIQYHDPELCSILDSKKVTPNLYLNDWFCSLFASSCCTETTLSVWDTQFKMADPFLIFFVAVVIVADSRDRLNDKSLDRDKILQTLDALPLQLQEEDIDKLYQLVSKTYANCTPRSIRAYSHLFFMDTFSSVYPVSYESFCQDKRERRNLTDDVSAKLTNTLDLSQYLCLPILPAEIFVNSDSESTALSFFLVDCRPSEQYNAGHLANAFHLDCSLMLREPSLFATAVQALLDIQKQVIESNSKTGGQHLCFIGSGDEEDRYVNMVVASFLQRGHRYVSIVIGGFDAIHSYIGEDKDLFDKIVVDHQPSKCKACVSNDLVKNNNTQYPKGHNKQQSATNIAKPGSGSPLKLSGLTSASSMLASATAGLLGKNNNSGQEIPSDQNSKQGIASLLKSNSNTVTNLSAATSIFDKFTTAIVSKTNQFRDKLADSLITSNQTASQLQERHVSQNDKLGPRYGGSAIFAQSMEGRNIVRDKRKSKDDPANEYEQIPREGFNEADMREVQIDKWQENVEAIAFFKCSHIVDGESYAGYIAVTKSHLYILRDIAHNKGFACIVAKRRLDKVLQITRKKQHQDLILFRYGNSTKDANDPKGEKVVLRVADSDHLQVEQSTQLIQVVKLALSDIVRHGL